MQDGFTAQTDGIACTRQWISVWLPDSESNPDGSGHWESVSIIKCKQIKDECVGVTNGFGIVTPVQAVLNDNERNTLLGKHKGTKCP